MKIQYSLNHRCQGHRNNLTPMPMTSKTLPINTKLWISLWMLVKLWNDSKGILRGLGENESWKKSWRQKSCVLQIWKGILFTTLAILFFAFILNSLSNFSDKKICYKRKINKCQSKKKSALKQLHQPLSSYPLCCAQLPLKAIYVQ